MSLHAVIVDEELPYPPTTGKRIRTLNLLLRLSQRHRITMVCHRNRDREEGRRAENFFSRNKIRTVVVPRSVPAKTGAWFYFRLFANLFCSLPYSVASHFSHDLRRAIQNVIADNDIDIIHCEWTPYAEVISNLGHMPRIVMAHNVESLIWQRYVKSETNPAKRWYLRHQWMKFEKFERRILSECDGVVAVSDDDARLMHERFGVSNAAVVENGIDRGYFDSVKGQRDRRKILFLGSLDWRPNLDAVNLLLERVFPAVLKEEPDSRLVIVGRNPPDRLIQRVGGLADVDIHPNVQDVRPYLACCGVMAVPLRIGGGSRIKILEALACGLPVVSTRVGAEGLRLCSGQELVITNDMDEMASALVACVRDPERHREMAERGRRLVLREYDWDALADRLEQVWLQCARLKDQPYSGAYVGAGVAEPTPGA